MKKVDEKDENKQLGSEEWFSSTYALWDNLYRAQRAEYGLRQRLIQAAGIFMAIATSYYPTASVTGVLVPASLVLSMLARYFYQIPAAHNFFSNIDLDEAIELRELLNALEANHFLELDADDPIYTVLHNEFTQSTAMSNQRETIAAALHYGMVLFLTRVAPVTSVYTMYSSMAYLTLSGYQDLTEQSKKMEQAPLEKLTLDTFNAVLTSYLPNASATESKHCYLKRGTQQEACLLFTVKIHNKDSNRWLLWSTDLVMAAYTPTRGNHHFVIALPIAMSQDKEKPWRYKDKIEAIFSKAMQTAAHISDIEKELDRYPAFNPEWKADSPFDKKHRYYWVKNPPENFTDHLKTVELNYETNPEGGVLVALFTDERSNKKKFTKLKEYLFPKQQHIPDPKVQTSSQETHYTFSTHFQGQLWKPPIRKRVAQSQLIKNSTTGITPEPSKIEIQREAQFELPPAYQQHTIIHLENSYYYVAIPPGLPELHAYTNWNSGGNKFVPLKVSGGGGDTKDCIKSHDNSNMRYIAAPFMEGEYQAGAAQDQSKPRLYVLFPTPHTHNDLDAIKKLPADILNMRNDFNQKRELNTKSKLELR